MSEVIGWTDLVSGLIGASAAGGFGIWDRYSQQKRKRRCVRAVVLAHIGFLTELIRDQDYEADARKVVDEKWKKIHDLLGQAGIVDADIKSNYSLYPKYDYVRQPCIADTKMGVAYPCLSDGKQVLTGYEVTQTADIKIRKLDDAGKILGILADNGATNVSGLTFTVEHEDAVQSTAREAAITKAKSKAEQLAKDLGVTLVRISSFNEAGNYPMYYGGGMMKAMSADGGTPAPNVPAGQNKYTSNVTIVYEIK